VDDDTMLIATVSTLIYCSADCWPVCVCRGLNVPFAAASAPASSSPTWCANAAVYPLADIIRNFHLGDSPWALILTYPTFLIPFCTW